jgi:hypothetical protein
MYYKKSNHFFKDYSKMSKQELLDVIEYLEEQIWSLREENNEMEQQSIMKRIEERERKETEEIFKTFPCFNKNLFNWEKP